MRSLVLFLCLMSLAQAQDIGLVPLSPFSYSGVVQQVTPGGVWLQTSNGINVMLPQGLDFEVAGTRVNVGGLVPGNTCQVYLPAGPAQLVALQGDVCTLMLPNGPCQVPVSSLPGSVLEKSKVAVLKPNGKVVNVPLKAALNMQRSQGARILGSSGQRYERWSSGQVLDGVVCGYQDDLLLVLDSQGRIVSVPRNLAGGLTPGRSIHVPGGSSFQIESWVPGAEHGKGNNNHGNNGHGNGKGKGKNK